MSRMARGLRLLKMLPPLTLITLLMPTTAPAVLKTMCQIWGKIELHRDPIFKRGLRGLVLTLYYVYL